MDEKKIDSKQVSAEPEVVRESLEIIEAAHEHADEALGFVEKHEGFTFTPEQDKAVQRKIDRHIMPLMFVSYVFQYMDKSVMAQSLIYGLQEDLHLVGQQYSWCGSAFYFGYLAFQPFAGRLLNKVPLGRFVSITAFAWAIILFCTPGAMNFSGLFACRFFLGAAEGGISPAYVLITGMWYKKDEIPQRMTFWFTGNGVAIIIQALLSYGIGHIKTSVATWRWFFIIFGILGLAWALVLFLFMPDSPLTAKFLTDDEKIIAVERLRANRTGVANKEFKKNQFIEGLTDPLVYYSFFYAISCVVPNSGVSFFGTLIIKGMGFNNFISSVLLMPFGAAECIALISSGYITRKWPNMRCIMQAFWCAPAVLGAALVYYLPAGNTAGRLAGFCITGFSNTALPLQFSLVSSNIAGHTKRSVSNAVMFLGYATGFIIGPQFFLQSESPRYPTGFKTMMITFAISCIAPLCLWGYLTLLNRRKEARLVESGGENVYARNEEFLDLTDREQIHFRYSK
ncbi:MFS general substrate transporter [Rhizodiscina lignyota]|uniref:MFS general substrate transporter n=1 Tax=Rhizodiscina lignyota TaxID=1504668 RepID=A0A9P4IQX8_9PEZI|nr:MFS general substrate transporter [Rhizodiscina lignyota]